MLDAVVRVSAPSRLHFGMLSFGQPNVRQYGGVGVMLDAPGLEVRVTPASRFETHGALADRATAIATAWAASHGMPGLPPCALHVLRAPSEHVGLGVGTQLALAIGRALHTLWEFPAEPIDALALRLGRGARSAVGTYGFEYGGFLVDPGKFAHETIAPPPTRLALSRDWRFVLVRPPQSHGLHGEAERTAFSDLPPVRPEVTDRLEAELRGELLPAAERGQLDRFGESLYVFGRLAGECFARVQGGPYNGPWCTRMVELLRAWGVLGVGQSSWGPTIFALMPNRSDAADLVTRLHNHGGAELEITVAGISPRGAEVRVE